MAHRCILLSGRLVIIVGSLVIVNLAVDGTVVVRFVVGSLAVGIPVDGSALFSGVGLLFSNAARLFFLSTFRSSSS